MSAVDYNVVHAVPGHGKSVHKEDWKKDKRAIPRVWGETFAGVSDPIQDHARLPVTTLREFYMLRFMNAITDKENWHIKVLDETIAQQWKDEAIAEAREVYRQRRDSESDSQEELDSTNELDQYPFFTVPRDGSDMTVSMADYCIAELQHRAREFSQSASGAIFVFNGDVVKSDTAVSTETRSALLDAVRVLEDVPDKDRHWRPGSNNQVLDLVHPNLFPVIFGTTRALPIGEKVLTLEDCTQRIGQGEAIPVPKVNKPTAWSRRKSLYSHKFQWLPCEVDITGEKAKIISYINNLHPKHQALYSVIEDVLTAAIPLWDITLAPLADYDHRPKRIEFEGVAYDPDTREWEGEGGPEKAWMRTTKRVILPEPEVDFSPECLESFEFSLKETLAPTKRPLQVVVKISNIELTPDNPDYPGGTWKAEGNQNEHIAATALYCSSSSNITAPSLVFRQISDANYVVESMIYDQHDYGWLSEVFGCEDGGPAVQVVGSVEMREGRLLTFPNILQHRIQPFSLKDRTKPSHAKILALLLVDPNVRVLSSAMVPPQQLDWWREDLEQGGRTSAEFNPHSEHGPSLQTRISELPAELKDHIYSEVDGFPIGLAEAKKFREELMEERKKLLVDQREVFEREIFYLSEF